MPCDTSKNTVLGVAPSPSTFEGPYPSFCHTPEKSGLPSAVRGVRAWRFGLPSRVFGTPAVGWRIHWASIDDEANNRAMIATVAIPARLRRNQRAHPRRVEPVSSGDTNALGTVCQKNKRWRLSVTTGRGDVTFTSRSLPQTRGRDHAVHPRVDDHPPIMVVRVIDSSEPEPELDPKVH